MLGLTFKLSIWSYLSAYNSQRWKRGWTSRDPTHGILGRELCVRGAVVRHADCSQQPALHGCPPVLVPTHRVYRGAVYYAPDISQGIWCPGIVCGDLWGVMWRISVFREGVYVRVGQSEAVRKGLWIRGTGPSSARGVRTSAHKWVNWFLPEASFGLRVLSLAASVCLCVR